MKIYIWNKSGKVEEYKGEGYPKTSWINASSLEEAQDSFDKLQALVKESGDVFKVLEGVPFED